MSYLLRVPGAEKKRKKKGICKTWMPIFFLVVMQFLRMRWWILLIWQLSFGVIEREKGKDYIILSRIAPWDKYLHLPCSACLFCCDSLIALVSHSPTTVAHLSPLSEPVEFALLSGVRDGDEGLEPLLVSAPFPLSLFSLFPLPQSSSFFFLYCSILFLSPQVLPSHILFKYFSLRLLRVSSNPRVVRQPEANGAVLSPVGSLRLDQGRNAVWHILIEKTWCPLLKSLVNSSSNLHIAPPPNLLLEPGWPPAKINEHFLLSLSKR